MWTKKALLDEAREVFAAKRDALAARARADAQKSPARLPGDGASGAAAATDVRHDPLGPVTDLSARYSYSDHRHTGSRHTGPADERVAVYVAVGVEEYRPGEGHVEDLLDDVPPPDLVNRSWRDYGNRIGAFRLFDRLEQFGIAPTVLLNTMVYDTAPAVTDAARKAGAEIIGHGVSNSDSLAEMDTTTQRSYLSAVAERIEKEEGTRPGGWSSPWLAHTGDTVDLLGATGYRYLLDLRADDQPMWPDLVGRDGVVGALRLGAERQQHRYRTPGLSRRIRGHDRGRVRGAARRGGGTAAGDEHRGPLVHLRGAVPTQAAQPGAGARRRPARTCVAHAAAGHLSRVRHDVPPPRRTRR